MEEVLRAQRDQAMKLLKENRGQSREALELLVNEHLGAIVTAARPDGAPPTPSEVESVYREVLNLSYVMFSLGYTLAQTGAADMKAR